MSALRRAHSVKVPPATGMREDCPSLGLLAPFTPEREQSLKVYLEGSRDATEEGKRPRNGRLGAPRRQILFTRHDLSVIVSRKGLWFFCSHS